MGPVGKAVSASGNQGCWGKCFYYGMIRLLVQEEGAVWRGFRVACLDSEWFL